MIKLIKVTRYPNINNPKLIVGIGDCKIGTNPHVLVTYSLGSCVAIILYDIMKKIASLIHSLLPEPRGAIDNPYKYVKTAIPRAVKDIEGKGAEKKNLVASVVGGASILKSTLSLSIGKRNVEAAKTMLAKYGIRIVASDTGGNYSRSVFFNISTGYLYIITPKIKLF